MSATLSTPPGVLPDLSVVIPCFNEVGNFAPLIEEIVAAITPLHRSFEILYIDDKSTDGSLAELLALRGKYPFLRVIAHKQNLGESAAFLTGVEHARGDIIITMDADLQNDPADIPEMLRLLDDADAVCGVRRKRDDSFSKRMSSRIANRVRGALLNDGIHDAGCTFRAIRREALAELPAFRAIHRFAPTVMKHKGFRVAEMTVNHRPRTRGVSKYGIGNRLWVGISDIRGIRWYMRRSFPAHRGEEVSSDPPS